MRMAVTGFCARFAGRRGLYLTGALSLTGCLSVCIPTIYCLVRDQGWSLLRSWINLWLAENHWDATVSQSIWSWLDWMDENQREILAGILSAGCIHIFTTILLVIGAVRSDLSLLIPWMITDIILIVILILIFISFTFISFFVDILVAIVFPVIAGLLLGVWIVLWRNTWRFYQQTGLGDKLLEIDSSYPTLDRTTSSIHQNWTKDQLSTTQPKPSDSNPLQAISSNPLQAILSNPLQTLSSNPLQTIKRTLYPLPDEIIDPVKKVSDNVVILQ